MDHVSEGMRGRGGEGVEGRASILPPLESRTSMARIEQTPFEERPGMEGKSLYLSSAMRVSRASKQPPFKLPTPTFDPEADYNFDSDSEGEAEAEEKAKEEAENDDVFGSATASMLRKNYKRVCKSLGVIPSSNVLRQLGSSIYVIKDEALNGRELKAILTTIIDQEIHHLDVSGTKMTVREAKYVTELLRKGSTVTHLILANSDLSGRPVATLAKCIKKNRVIRHLDLSGNGLCDRDAEPIIDVIQDTDNLGELILAHNELGSCGKELGKALAANDTIHTLDLSWNHIRTSGAVGIAKGIEKNQHISELNLAWNGFGFEGCSAMAQALTVNTTVQILDLTNNRVHGPALCELLPGLTRNKTLTTLKIGYNPIPASWTGLILDKIRRWKESSIRELDMQGIVVDKAFHDMLEKLKEERLILVRYDMALPLNKHELAKVDPKNVYNIDPVRILYFMKQHLRTIDLFLKFDRDVSGQLAPEEIKYAFECEGFPISDRALHEVMNYLDTNNDGEIDLLEFMDGERRLKRKLIEEREEKATKTTEELQDEKDKKKFSRTFTTLPKIKR